MWSARWIVPLLALMGWAGCVYERRAWTRHEEEAAARHPVTLEDLRALKRAGIGDDVILARLRAEGVAARPTAEEIVQLKKEGVSDRVIEALVSSEVKRRVEPRVVYRYEPWPTYGYPVYDWGWWGWPYPHWNFHFYYSRRHRP